MHDGEDYICMKHPFGRFVSNAQGIPNPFTTLWNGGRELLRSMSYYEMKNRAGVIGRGGLGPMLGKLAAADPGIRIHLMGHSFGARLVAYSLSGLPPAATCAQSPVKTLYLIQGAFSHFAFANPVPDPLVSGPGALSAFTRNVNGLRVDVNCDYLGARSQQRRGYRKDSSAGADIQRAFDDRIVIGNARLLRRSRDAIDVGDEADHRFA